MHIVSKIIIFIGLLTSLQAEINYKDYFKNCSKELNNSYFQTCYNYEFKSATASYIELSEDKVNSKNISQRHTFYEDLNIPEEYRGKTEDWTGSGKDRGHIQSDASNDYSEESKNATYIVSNITMQEPLTNRRSYLEVEKRERELAIEHKNIKVLTIISYSENSINGIRIL